MFSISSRVYKGSLPVRWITVAIEQWAIHSGKNGELPLHRGRRRPG